MHHRYNNIYSIIMIKYHYRGEVESYIKVGVARPLINKKKKQKQMAENNILHIIDILIKGRGFVILIL